MKRNQFKRQGSNAADENEIEYLKQEVHQLKDLECDLFRLNDEIACIQAKYNIVLDEKERTEVINKTKVTLSRQAAKELQADVDVIKVKLNQSSLDIDNLIRDNVTLQKTCDNKENEINSLTVAVKEMERTNENKLMELKATEQSLHKIKEHKLKMEEECDKLCRRLNEKRECLKQLEKETKGHMIVEESLTSTLEHLKEECEILLAEVKLREDVLKETTTQYENFCLQVKEGLEENERLSKECKNSQDNYNRLSKTLEINQKSNQEKTEKLREIDNCVGRCEEELSKTVSRRDSLMKEHSDLATKNKDLNLEIDDCLMKILQLENVNKALQKHIEQYISCDEEARYLLDRKQKMTELLQTVGCKLSKTQSAIAHLI